MYIITIIIITITNLRIHQIANNTSPTIIAIKKDVVGTTTRGIETLQDAPVKPPSHVQDPVPVDPINREGGEGILNNYNVHVVY